MLEANPSGNAGITNKPSGDSAGRLRVIYKVCGASSFAADVHSQVHHLKFGFFDADEKHLHRHRKQRQMPRNY